MYIKTIKTAQGCGQRKKVRVRKKEERERKREREPEDWKLMLSSKNGKKTLCYDNRIPKNSFQ